MTKDRAINILEDKLTQSLPLTRSYEAIALAIVALRAHDDLVVACEMAKSRPVNIDELIESGRIFHIDGEIWGIEIAVIEEALAAATQPITETEGEVKA